MNKSVILAAVAGLALGTGLFLNLNQIVTLFQQNTSPLFNAISPWLTQIQQVFSQIPQEWRAILLVTVPTGIGGLLVTWWKNRQMNKLAEASMNKIQELSTLNMNAQQLQSNLQVKNQELQAQVDQYAQQNVMGTVQSLQSQLDDQKSRYESQISLMQRDMNAMETTYQNIINDLKQRTVTVVK